MVNRLRIVPLFLLLLASVTARAAEVRVELAPELTGAWLTPDSGWHGRTMLLLHGFADDMDGAGDLTKRLAEGLAARGIASLRINFRGEGDRKRTDIASTFPMRLEDTATARAFLVKQPGVDAAHLGAMGWSLGASTAIETGARHPDWFRTMVLWSSPSGDAYAGLTNSPTAQKALRNGVASETVPGWKTITTHREFYESFRGINLDQSLAKYPGALLSVRGSLDFLPQRDAELLKLAPGHPTEAVLIGGANHIFDVFQPELGHAERALKVTMEWAERTL